MGFQWSELFAEHHEKSGMIAVDIDQYDQPGHSDHQFKEFSMITETSEVAFRQNLGDMLNQVHYCGDSIVINKDGKPIAALVNARLFARIRRLQRRFDELSDRLAQGFEGVSEVEGLAEIDAAGEASRLKQP